MYGYLCWKLLALSCAQGDAPWITGAGLELVYAVKITGATGLSRATGHVEASRAWTCGSQ